MQQPVTMRDLDWAAAQKGWAVWLRWFALRNTERLRTPMPMATRHCHLISRRLLIGAILLGAIDHHVITAVIAHVL